MNAESISSIRFNEKNKIVIKQINNSKQKFNFYQKIYIESLYSLHSTSSMKINKEKLINK